MKIQAGEVSEDLEIHWGEKLDEKLGEQGTLGTSLLVAVETATLEDR